MAFDALGHFDCMASLRWLAMRNGDDEKLCSPADDLLRNNDNNRSVLQPLFLPDHCFAVPKIGIGNDVCRFRRRP